MINLKIYFPSSLSEKSTGGTATRKGKYKQDPGKKKFNNTRQNNPQNDSRGES